MYKTIIIFSVTLILLFFINSVLTKKNQASYSDDNPTSFSVKIQECKSQNRTIHLNLSGTINPLQRVSLTSKISGQITDLYLSDGDKIEEGDLVLKIEDDGRIEQIEKAKSFLKQRETEYDSSQKLHQKGYRAKIQVEAAFAALQSARADLKRLELDLQSTEIKSPIDGHIDKINVSKGDFVSVGQKIADIVNFDQILVVLYISENEVNKIEVGETAQINLLNGRALAGEVNFISRVAEPKTGSYRVEIRVTNDETIFLQGSTANVKIPSGEKIAYKVPSSSLNLSNDGVLGIKIVDNDNYVVFIPIEIVDYENDGVWVSASNEDKTIKLIVLGHLFVQPGDKVDTTSYINSNY
jgi:multidrug efflux system membrane fusion protein